MNLTSMNFNEKLVAERYQQLFRAIRLMHNLKQADLAFKVGLTQASISKIESNKGKHFIFPEIKVLFNLVDEFELDMVEVKNYIQGKSFDIPIPGYKKFLADRLDNVLLGKYPKSLAEVRKAIQKKYPKLDITKNKTYFYFFSDDEKLGVDLFALQTTSVHTYRVTNKTLGQWVQEADDIMNELQKVLDRKENRRKNS